MNDYNWNTLKYWKFHCMELIPIEFPQGITVQEQLAKAWYYINVMLKDLKVVEGVIDDLPETIAKEVASQVAVLKATLEAQMQAITDRMDGLEISIKDDVDKAIEDLQNRVNAQLEQQQKDMAAQAEQLREELANGIAQVNQAVADVNAALQQTETYINLRLAEMASDIDSLRNLIGDNKGYLVNPMTGETGEQNVIFSSVYDWLRRPLSMTCGEMVQYGITYGGIRDKGLTCGMWSTESWKWKEPILLNPLTGKRAHLQTILANLSAIPQALPNWRYDTLDVTPDSIYNSDMTYSEYSENQNYLRTENVNVYARFANGSWIGKASANATAKIYTAEDNAVDIAISNDLIIDKAWNCLATIVTNSGDIYTISAEFGHNMFHATIPAEYYGQEIAVLFEVIVVTQS